LNGVQKEIKLAIPCRGLAKISLLIMKLLRKLLRMANFKLKTLLEIPVTG
jgi:hypothetical protein